MTEPALLMTVCNLRQDCSDNSGEHIRARAASSHQGTSGCLAEEFQCWPSGISCIGTHLLCHSSIDCSDVSDEACCQTNVCRVSEHGCTDGKCVEKSKVCDGIADSTDQSDESSCRTEAQCRGYLCRSGSCISSKKNPVLIQFQTVGLMRMNGKRW